MTHTNEQERTEFEQIMRKSPAYKPELMNRIGDRYEFDTMESAWQGFLIGMQAARRAQVVPQGYKITEEQHVAAVKVLHRAAGIDGLPQRMLDAMLAAAPQPPEAAPVQMPEPFTTLVRKTSWSQNCYEASPRSHHKDYGKQWADERVNVYTEHQVRQLLAQHGVK